MLHGDGFNEGLLNELFELGRELGPVAGDLLAEEDGGELADVGGFGGAHVLNEGGNHLGVLGQTLNLVLGLTAGVVVGHEELNQQQLERLRHLMRVRVFGAFAFSLALRWEGKGSAFILCLPCCRKYFTHHNLAGFWFW